MSNPRPRPKLLTGSDGISAGTTAVIAVPAAHSFSSRRWSRFPKHRPEIFQATLGRFEFRKPASFLFDQKKLDAPDRFRRGNQLFPRRDPLPEQDSVPLLLPARRPILKVHNL